MDDLPQIYYYIAICIFLAYGIFSDIKCKFANIKKFALQLIVKAELELKDGSDKYIYVSNIIYKHIPVFIKIFMTESMLQKIIKKLIDDGIDKIKQNMNKDNESDSIESLIKQIKNSSQ